VGTAMFRNGPERRGWYPDVAVPRAGWTYQADRWIKSSPALAGDTAYAGSLDGTVHAVDLRTGRPRWTRPLGSGVDGSPAMADGVVYIGAAGGRVFALDAATGGIRWAYTGAGGEGGGSSPAVAGGLVIIGGAGHELLALDAGTGRLRWSYPTGARLVPGVPTSPPARGALDSSPLVVDGTVFLSDGELHAVALADGSPQWTAATVTSGLCSPAAAAGLLYVAELGSYVRAVDAATGVTRWRVEVTDALFRFGTPAVADGLVLISAEGRVADGGSAGFRVAGGLVVALDAGTGEQRWRRHFTGRVLSSPAAADGLVHVVESSDSGSALVTVDSPQGTEVRRRRLPGSGDPRHSFVSSPAIGGQTLYVGTVDGALVASTVDGAVEPGGEAAVRRRRWRRSPVDAPATSTPAGPPRGKPLSTRERSRLRQIADREAERALIGLRGVDRSGTALGHSAKAIAAIERLRTDDPDNWVHAEQLAGKLYNHAALLELMGRTGEAAEAAERSLATYAEAAGGPLPEPEQLGMMYQLDRLSHHRVNLGDPDARRLPPWEFAMRIADVSARLAMLLARSEGPAAADQVRRLVQLSLDTYREMARVEPRHQQDLIRVAGLGRQALGYLGDT
jgi:outer membrane protein assembly factor BamB